MTGNRCVALIMWIMAAVPWPPTSKHGLVYQFVVNAGTIAAGLWFWTGAKVPRRLRDLEQ